MWTALLAQAADAAPAPTDPGPATAPPSTWVVIFQNLDAVFWLTLLFIFLTAIIVTIFNARRKDKCLKLLRDYHVSYLTTTGQTLWGDLVVYARGIELEFDTPYRNSRNIHKSSALIYEAQLANCLAICRIEPGLTPKEARQRRRQVRRTFRPNILRRFWRQVRNVFNTLKDAFNKAIGVILGQLAKANPSSRVLTTQRSGVEQIGQTMLGAAANAYEPILERHIGKRVVLELKAAGENASPIELPGYLVEYSEKYVAVFNVEHEPLEDVRLELTDSAEREGVRVELGPTHVMITCTGNEALVVNRYGTAAGMHDLEVAVTCGCTVRVPRPGAGPVHLHMQRTRRIDVVCPRSVANIHFGGAEVSADARAGFQGIAPEQAADEVTQQPAPPATGPAT